jgi:hypothetical protein
VGRTALGHGCCHDHIPHFHDLWLEIGVELGLIGIFIAAATTIIVVFSVWRWALRDPGPESCFFVGFVTLIMLLASLSLVQYRNSIMHAKEGTLRRQQGERQDHPTSRLTRICRVQDKKKEPETDRPGLAPPTSDF